MQSPISSCSQQQKLADEDGQRRHERTPGSANTKGIDYEIKMAALLFLRGVNSGRDFELAGNVKVAGCFDDVIYKFLCPEQGWQTCCIQLKHKDSYKVNKDSLLTLKGDFGLIKYFKSFMEIKQKLLSSEAMDLFNGTSDSCHFVIFTNAELESWKGNLETCDLASPVDRYIKLNPVKSSFTEDMVQRLYSDLKNEEEKQNSQRKPQSQLISSNEGDVKDFLRRVKVFTGQPSETQLDLIIESEMKGFCKNVGGEYFDFMYLKYKEAFKKWHRGEGIILDKNSDILSQALHDAQAEALLPVVTALALEEEEKFALDIRFLDDSTVSLKNACADQHSLVNVVAEESVRITANKVLQILETRKDSYIFVGARCLLTKRKDVMTSWRHGKKHLLVIVSDETSLQTLDEICTEISQVLLEVKEKQVVLVSSSNDSFARQLEEKMETNFIHFRDSFQMTQLNQESIDSIFRKQVIFQEKPTTLQMIIGSDLYLMSNELKDVLETIIASKSLVVGDNLNEDKEYYVPRTMQCKNIVDNKIFTDMKYAGRIIIHGATMADVDELVPTHEQRIIKKFQQRSEGLVFNAYDEDNSEDREKVLISRNDIHYLERIDGRLVWKRTVGKISFVKSHIDDSVSNTIQDPRDRVVLLSAEPGMGKTTLLTHEAQRIKQSHPGSWVVPIALNNHTSLFASTKGQELNVEQFLKSALGLDKLTALDRALFRYALRHSGKMTVFLDGFDEVAPTYTDQCLSLINKLLTTNAVSVWISTRFSMRNTLEACLSKLASTLQVFSLEDQRMFLVKYWGSCPGVVKEELDEHINKILQMTALSMNDKEKDFTGIPLQTRMLAEIYQDSITNIQTIIYPESLNILKLIEIFVDKKFDTYIQKTCTSSRVNTDFNRLLSDHKRFVQMHTVSALFVLFDESDLQSLDMKISKELLSDLKMGVDKGGIVDQIVDCKPVFLHRVFAEYFAALWFADYYHSNTEFTSKHLLGKAFGVVRHMFDRILARDSQLHNAVLNLSTANVQDLLKTEIDVNSTDKGGRTALHLAIIVGLHNPSKNKPNIPIIQLLMSHNARVDMKDNVLQWTPVQYADASEQWAEINTLLNHCTLDASQFNTMVQNIADKDFWDSIIKNDYSNVLSLLIRMKKPQTKVVNKIQQKIGMKPSESSQSSYFKSKAILHRAAALGSIEIVRFMIKRAMHQEVESVSAAINISGKRSWFVRRALKKLLTVCDELGMNALMIATNHGQTSAAREILASIEDEKARAEFVNTRNKFGNTALMLTCVKGHQAAVELLISSGADVTAVDKYGRTGLMMASVAGHNAVVKSLLVAINGKDCVTKCNSVGNASLLKQELQEIANLLLASKIQAYEKLMISCNQGLKSVVTSLLAEINDEKEILVFLNRRNGRHDTALFCASGRGHDDIVALLIAEGADVTTQDSKGRTGLIWASLGGHSAVVETLLAAIGDEKDRVEYVNKHDRWNQTALFLASWWGYDEIVKLLIAKGAQVTTRDSWGSTGLMFASRGGHVAVVETLISSIRVETDRVEFVNRRDMWGKDALSLASRSGHNGIVDMLIAYGATTVG